MKKDIRVGDVILPRSRVSFARIITEVRDTGYSWRYVDRTEDHDFVSENSNDPFFELGWHVYRQIG